MLFTRWEVNAVQIITGSYNSGYGHEFEKAVTRFDGELRQSMGHQRIMKYNLGGIECLARFEVDAYIEGDANFDDDTKPDTPDLPAAFSTLTTQSGQDRNQELLASEVRVVERGRLVDLGSIAEIKSRNQKSKLKMKDIIPQLWISQTQKLFVGYHKEGLVEKKPLRGGMATHFRQWEAANQDQLKRMVGAINGIKDAVKEKKGGKSVQVCDKEEKTVRLELYERKGTDILLPSEARNVCWGIGSS